MPQVIVSLAAREDLRRFDRFLKPKNPDAARRAALAIKRGIESLSRYPETGRPFGEAGVVRELLIPFGSCGYFILYEYNDQSDAIVVLAPSINGKLDTDLYTCPSEGMLSTAPQCLQ